MIRVLHVIDKLSVDGSGIHGIARALEWWAARLDRRRVSLRILSLRGREEDAACFFEERGLDLRFVRLSKFDPRTLPVLCREARNFRADVLHLHGYAAADFGRPAARVMGIPNIVHEHVVFPEQPSYQVWADRLLAGMTDAAMAISPAVEDFMVEGRAVPQRLIETFFYGIPFDEFEPPSRNEIEAARAEAGAAPGEPVVLTAGRLAPQKGLGVLAEAFAEIARMRPNARLVVVGEGPERENLRRHLEQRGIADRAFLAGFRRDVRPWIALASVFVIPSFFEGGPITLFEAMRLGRPIISTPVGLVPVAVRDGREGRLVPVGDARTLAGVLEEVLGDPVAAEEMGKRARAASEQWDVAHAVERLTKAYERIVRCW